MRTSGSPAGRALDRRGQPRHGSARQRPPGSHVTPTTKNTAANAAIVCLADVHRPTSSGRCTPPRWMLSNAKASTAAMQATVATEKRRGMMSPSVGTLVRPRKGKPRSSRSRRRGCQRTATPRSLPGTPPSGARGDRRHTKEQATAAKTPHPNTHLQGATIAGEARARRSQHGTNQLEGGGCHEVAENVRHTQGPRAMSVRCSGEGRRTRPNGYASRTSETPTAMATPLIAGPVAARNRLGFVAHQ